MKNRYIITRVECPLKNDIDAQFVCFPEDNECSGCRYGDTKEQLIRKVAQVFFKRKLKSYKKLFDIVPNNKDAKQVYKCCLDVAKEIVEFLGVEK